MPIPSLTHWTVRRFLDRLASSDPTPGGGSAAALAGALGASLGSMVCRILLERPGLQRSQRRRLEKDRKALDRICRGLASLIQEDARAYHQLVQAQRIRRGIRRAMAQAIQCPLKICQETAEASRIMKALLRKTGPYLGSDVRSGRALLRGAFEAAWMTAEVNLKGSRLSRVPADLRKRLSRLRGLVER